jgi:hypothetical protein
MSISHVSEMEIQQYAVDKTSCEAGVVEHISACAVCGVKADNYLFLFSALKEADRPVAEFDVEDAVMAALPSLPVRKESFALRDRFVYVIAFAAFASLGVLVWLLRRDVFGVFDGLTVVAVLVLLIPVTGILVWQCYDWYKKYKNIMKKIALTTMVLIGFLSAKAGDNDPGRDIEIKWESFRLFSMLLTCSFFAVVILYFIKMLLDDRIKNKLIEKGAPDGLITQLLQPPVKDTKTVIVKWICILGSGGIGLLLAEHFQPLGIQTLAIMSVSIAAGFLAYFFFLRSTEKNK